MAGAWGRPGGGEGGGLKPLVLAAPSTRLQRCWQHPGPAHAAPATSTTTHSRAPGQQEPPHLLCVLQIQQARLPSAGESSGALERTRAPRWDVERMLCAQVSSALAHTHPSGSSELWERGSSCCLCQVCPARGGWELKFPTSLLGTQGPSWDGDNGAAGEEHGTQGAAVGSPKATPGGLRGAEHKEPPGHCWGPEAPPGHCWGPRAQAGEKAEQNKPVLAGRAGEGATGAAQHLQ